MRSAQLQDQVAIITGGGRGIGRAVALGYAHEGARVVVAARSTAEITSAADEIAAFGGQALAVVCDVSQEDEVKALVERTAEHFGPPGILVNNAGVGNLRPVWGIPKRAFEQVLAVNLVGTFLCTKHVWRPMRDAGGGVIINVSSLGGLTGYPLLSAYCASKWGQIGFTKACAEEGKADGIRVNAIAPGKVDTAFRQQISEDKGRMLKAEDHVGTCIFLASSAAEHITGQVIAIDWVGPPPAT